MLVKRTFLGLALCIVATHHEGVGAQVDLRAAEAVSRIAREVCARPKEYGMTETRQGQVSGRLKTGAIVRRFGTLGFDARQSKTTSSYQGVPARDLVNSLADYNACVRDLMSSIPKNYRIVAKAPATNAKPERYLRPISKPRPLVAKPTPQKQILPEPPPVQSQKQVVSDTRPPLVVKQDTGAPAAERSAASGSVAVEILRVRKFVQTFGKQEYISVHLTMRLKSAGQEPGYFGLLKEYGGASLPFDEVLAGWRLSNDAGTSCAFQPDQSGVRLLTERSFSGLNGENKEKQAAVDDKGLTVSLFATCHFFVEGAPFDMDLRLFRAPSNFADCDLLGLGTMNRLECLRRPWTRVELKVPSLNFGT